MVRSIQEEPALSHFPPAPDTILGFVGGPVKVAAEPNAIVGAEAALFRGKGPIPEDDQYVPLVHVQGMTSEAIFNVRGKVVVVSGLNECSSYTPKIFPFFQTDLAKTSSTVERKQIFIQDSPNDLMPYMLWR